MVILVPKKLQTERLKLRQFVEQDWEAIHAYFSDQQATTFTFGRALSESASRRALQSMIQHWEVHGYGPYALEEKANGNVIGTVGFWYPDDWPELEIKWALSRQYWSKGYASEAVRAVQKAALQCFQDKPLISFIHSENAASIKLALAVGATFEKQQPFRSSLWHIYRHPKSVLGTLSPQ